MKRRIIAIIFIIFCLCMTGCKNKNKSYETPQVKVNEPTIEVGDKTNMIIDNYDNFNDFIITTNPNGIVSVSTSGEITALKSGDVDIIITHKLNSDVSKTVKLTVTKKLQPIDVTVNFDKEILEIGDNANLVISNYENISDFLVTCNPADIISIDNLGIITALKEGNVDITVTHKNDSQITKTIKLTINKKAPIITVEENLKVGGIYDFSINGKTDFTDYSISYSDQESIKIENGYIYCFQKGTFQITVSDKTNEKLNTQINVVVNEKTTSTTNLPEFNINKAYAEVGNKISIRFKPGYTVNDFDFITNLFDENGDSQIIFDNNFRMQGLKPCKEILFARLKTNHDIVLQLEFEFTTINPKIFVYRNKLFVNETSYVTISNFDKTYEKNIDEYIITSSDEKILLIDGTTITAVGVGTAQVIFTSKYNERVSSSYSIEVLPSDEGRLSMRVTEQYNGTVTNGEQFHLDIYNGTNISQDLSKFTFVSSDDEILRVTAEGVVTIVNEGYGSVTAYETGNPSNKILLCLNIHGEPNVDYISRLLHLAINEKGYVERYDPVTGQYVNDTKYNHWYNMDGAWCAMFVSWCWFHSGLSNELLVKYCSCSAGKAWCESVGIFNYKKNYTPKSGDIVFFLSAGASHTGIVIYCDNTYVYTIEGNASNRVDVWRWSINDARITGYASPHYPNYTGEQEDFSWIKEKRDDQTYWWNNVPEKQEMV